MKRITSHPGRLLTRDLAARKLSANRLSLDIGVPSGRFTDILNGRRSITADTAVRHSRYFSNSAQFWLDLRSQNDSAIVEREKGSEIAKRVRPADAAWCGLGIRAVTSPRNARQRERSVTPSALTTPCRAATYDGEWRIPATPLSKSSDVWFQHDFVGRASTDQRGNVVTGSRFVSMTSQVLSPKVADLGAGPNWLQPSMVAPISLHDRHWLNTWIRIFWNKRATFRLSGPKSLCSRVV